MTVLRKVGIIGIGHVGAHVANAVLSAGLAEELKLCDINEQKVVSECQDLSDTLGFYPHNCVIGNYGTQYEQLADCDVVINAAGDVKTSAKDRDGELFVSFWNSGDDYAMMTEDEFEDHLQNTEMTMGGM